MILPNGDFLIDDSDVPYARVDLAFDPSQPRDEKGRWSGSGSLYHGTSVEVAKKIKNEGLLPISPSDQGMFVFASTSDRVALSYASTRSDDDAEHIALITLKPEAARYFRQYRKDSAAARGWANSINTEVVSEKTIPPDLIESVKVYSHADLMDAVKSPDWTWEGGKSTDYFIEPVTSLSSRGSFVVVFPFKSSVSLSFNPDQPRDDRGRWTDGLGGVPTLSPADVLTGDVMVHGSPHAELSQLQPGSMFSNDPRWAAGYTTRSVNGSDDEQFVGAIHALEIPSGPTVYVRSVHDAERKLVEMAQSFGGRMPSNLKDAAEIVSRHSDLVAILAKRDGRITGGILVRPAGVTGRANPRETLNEAMDRGLPVPSNLERALKLNLSFDPAQPRDEIGRWTDGGGSPAVRQAADRLSKAEALANGHLSDAETRMRKIGASNIEEALKDSKYHAAYERYIDATRQAAMAKRELTVYTSADRVATQMGIDPRRVHVVQRDPREFEVGDMQFREGGRYNSETGLIEINARHIENELQADVIVAHELTHHVWSTIHRVSNSERNEIRALPPDEYNEMFTRGGFVRPDRVKDADERWPATRLLSRHTDAVTAATEEEYNSIDQRMAKLAEEDGVTTYSKAYWDAAAKVSNADNRRYPTFTAINETLAEMQAIRHGKVADLESRTAARSRVWNSFITDMLHTAKTHPKIKERLF